MRFDRSLELATLAELLPYDGIIRTQVQASDAFVSIPRLALSLIPLS